MVLRNFDKKDKKIAGQRVLPRLDALRHRSVQHVSTSINTVKIFILTIALFLGACAPVLTQMPDILPPVVTVTDSPEPEQSLLATPPAEATPTLDMSATPEFTASPSGPTPTETLLPPLELPTERPSAPAQIAWTGLPTYPGDSEAGRLFRVDYDPDIWAQTEGNYGDVVLAHRQIDYCTITPWAGRGLPPDSKVEHEFRLIGEVPYDVNTVVVQDKVEFVSYVGGDQRLLTGFQVTFEDQKDPCLQDAEIVLATLRSFVAQPTITPSFTPDTSTPPSTSPSATP
jgi:hypothetical protein